MVVTEYPVTFDQTVEDSQYLEVDIEAGKQSFTLPVQEQQWSARQYPDAVGQYDRTLAQTRADRCAALKGEQADQVKASPEEIFQRDRRRGDAVP